MNNDLRLPPLSFSSLTPPDILAERLRPLIGVEFQLSMFPRTNGSKIRKLIAATLEQYPLPEPCPRQSYTIVPPKGKGVPRILREYIDTYIITTGRQYNLQVWNRNPTGQAALIEYASGDKLAAQDVRYVLIRVNPQEHYIQSVLVLTPMYIEASFGPFGKETVKQQLIITPRQRDKIVRSNPPILFYPDTSTLAPMVSYKWNTPVGQFKDMPTRKELFALEILQRKLYTLIGTHLPTSDTKTRGQALERLVAQLLGYTIVDDGLLRGGYLDIFHQLLEVKLQEAATVDLGRYSPQVQEAIPGFPQATTEDVRYLIALVNKVTGIIEGLVLCPGNRLGDHFSYVSDSNYKCQRGIPMSFFDRYDGLSVFNP